LVGLVAAPLGIAGGFLLYLATVACLSSWLALVGQVIRLGRVRLSDLPSSFVAYLGDLLTVAFLLWGLRLIGTLVLAPFPFLAIVFGLAVVVFLNAVPELLYLGQHTAAELLVESYRFIGANWIEWFPANLLLAAAVLATLMLPPGRTGSSSWSRRGWHSPSRRSSAGSSSRSWPPPAVAAASSGGARRGRDL